ncbi:hypothetical protein [Phormidesmis sp. 146-33]
MDFKTMSIAQLKEMRVSIEAELAERVNSSKEKTHAQNMAIAESLIGKIYQPGPQTQQTIAAKSEAEIQVRAEQLMRSASNQRVII